MCLCLCCGGVFSQESYIQYAFKNLSVNNGLSQNSVTGITQSTDGFLWLATQDGLCQFNGVDVERKDYAFMDKTRLEYYRLGKVFADSNNNLWIAPKDGSLVKENKSIKKIVTEINQPSAFAEFQNKIWVGTNGNGIFTIANKIVTKAPIKLAKDEIVYDILPYQNQYLWISTNYNIYKYSIPNKKTIALNKPNNYSSITIGKNTIYASTFMGQLFTIQEDKITHLDLSKFNGEKLPSYLTIYDLVEDNQGRLWVGTFKNGLYVINFKTRTIQHLVYNKQDKRSLKYDYILSLFKDNNGVIWVGTDGGGVSYYDENLDKFNLLINENLPKDVFSDLVISISVDSESMVWLGTSGKGLTKYNPKTKEGKTFTIKDNKRILSLLHDSKGIFWIGLFQDGLYYFDENKGITNVNIQTKNRNYKNLSISWIKELNTNDLLFGTYNQGVFLYNKAENTAQQFSTKTHPLMRSNIMTCAIPFKNNSYLLGQGNGDILEYNINNKTLKNYVKGDLFNSSLVKSLYYKNKLLFVGTTNGLLKLKDRSILQKLNTNIGLPNNVIYSIVPGIKNQLWLSTNKGIVKLENIFDDNEIPHITSFTKEQGLQGNEFNTGAHFKDSKGNIYFGGIDGVNWFKPENITINKSVPTTKITQFLDTKNKQNLSYELAHHQNDITIKFSSSSIILASKNNYKYRLIGLNQDWKNIGSRNYVDFISLPPGDYEFEVIGTNYDGIWSKTPATLHFTIFQPWYTSKVAWIIYLMLLLTGVYLAWRIAKNRYETQIKLQNMEELNKYKSKLYSEISHEFKTPLTLIKGNIKQLKKEENLSYKQKDTLNSAEENTTQILGLINQMLDLASIDAKQFTLNYNNYNIIEVLKFSTAVFKSVSESKHQNLIFDSEIEELWMQVDFNNLKKIINNLLSNAIKFTPENGTIIIQASVEKDTTFLFSVIDTGQGIEQQHLSRVFDRHYRTFDLDNNIGNGIGMSLCNELIQLMKGDIYIKSEVGKGSIFTVRLPIIKGGVKTAVIQSVNIKTSKSQHISAKKTTNTKKQYHIIIVEDNKNMQKYYESLLTERYNLTFYDNGKVALNGLENHVVDFILSDILMPKMDGYNFCMHVKNDWKTSHIPFIIVSGKATTTDKQKGYQLGVDAYLAKPFEEAELQILIESLLQKRKEQSEYYKKLIKLESGIKQKNNLLLLDFEFIQEFQQLILNSSKKLSINDLTKLLGMSRTQLHRKIKVLAGLSTTEYIHHIQIEKAKELLLKTKLSVKEVAYDIGFSDPGYFTKVFKNFTKKTPNSYRKGN